MVGFWGKFRILRWVLGADIRHLGGFWKWTQAFDVMCILKAKSVPKGTIAPKIIYVGPPLRANIHRKWHALNKSSSQREQALIRDLHLGFLFPDRRNVDFFFRGFTPNSPATFLRLKSQLITIIHFIKQI